MYESPFFKKFPQQWSSFINDGGEEKRYLFPTFYENVRGMNLVLSCSWEKARAALPGKRLFPAPVGLGKAAVAVAAFEFLNPQNMGPYREVLFGIPVVQIRPAALPAVGLFVKRLIVDVEENIQRGKHLWGMDKQMGELKFFDSGDYRACEVYRNGRRALRMEVPTKGKSRQFEECRSLITEKDGSLLGSRVCSSGRKVELREEGGIVFGADPFAVEIESLKVYPIPLLSRYLPAARQSMGLPRESCPLA